MTPAVVVTFLTVERRTAEPHASICMQLLGTAATTAQGIVGIGKQSTWAWVQSQYYLTLVGAGRRRKHVDGAHAMSCPIRGHFQTKMCEGSAVGVVFFFAY